MTAGVASNYNFAISNTGFSASGTTLDVYEQLPANVQFNSGAGAGGGSVPVTGVSCTPVSGTVATGQLLRCRVNVSSGIPAGSGTANFTLNVTPLPGVASSVANKARIDPTGANAAQTPSACTATGTPAGCAVTTSQSVGNGVTLGLTKANPASLTVGATSSYTLTLSNTGSAPSANSIDVYEQLPVGVGFANAAAPVSGGTDTPTGVSCVKVGSGTVTSGGELLKCTVTFSAGLRASTGTGLFSVSVTPLATAVGQSVTNKAAVDSSGGNAAQTPASCTGQNTPTAGCTVSPAQTVQGTVTLGLSKTSPASGNVGGVSSYAFTLSNSGNIASGSSLVVFDELPQNLEFYDIQPSATGSAQPSASSCSVTGSAANNPGQSLICSITIPGGIPAGGSAGFNIRVLAKAGGTTGSNKAAVDPTGNNAVQTPGACSATGSPAGCAVAPGFSVSAVGPVVSLFKGVTPSASSLRAGVASTYRITIGNSSANSTASAQSHFVFSDQLPPGFDWTGASAVSSGSPSFNPANPTTTITPSAVSCSPSGTVAAGLLVTCTVDLPSLLVVNSFAAVDLQVKPRNSAIAYSATNKARIDATGLNAPQGSAAVAACSTTDSPMGCAVSTNTVSAGSGSFLELTKEDPATLAVGVSSAYTVTITNKGVDASGTSIVELYDKLPANVAFISAAPTTGGTASASSATCAVQSGSGSAVATGELLKCTLNVGTGGLAANGSVMFLINVMPNASVSTTTPLSNKAAVDATGGNAVADPTVCTGLNTPNPGCTVSPGKTVGNGVNLGLSKSNPASLAVGTSSAYTLTLSNTGTGPSGNSIDVYEQLPVGVGFANVAAPVSGGTVTPSGVSCSVQSGDVTTGQLLKCTVSLSAGIPASTGTAKFSVSVTPVASASGTSVTNKAAVDSTGGNAAQTPATCTGTNTPTPGCTTSAPQTVGNGINLSLSKTSPASGSVAGLSSYALQITNNGAVTTGTSLTLLDQLPQNMQFFDIAPSSAGSVTPSSAACSVSGSASSNPGQLLTCTVGLASGLATGATATVTVRAQALVSGTTGPNKASVDPLGGSAAPTPSTCTATGTPAGCAVSPGVTVSASGPVVTLRKSAFPLDSSLKANAVSTYRIAIGNNDSFSAGPAQPHLEFYDLLWPGFNLVGASVVPAGSASRDPANPTTSVAASSVSCSSVGGSVAAGLLVKCVVDLPSMLAVGQNLAVDLQVLPGNSATAFIATNKARIDSTGFNAAQSSTSVSNCSSTGSPMGCAVTTNQVAAGSLTQLGLSKDNPANLAVGLTSSYTLTLSNTGGGVSGNSIDVYEQLPVGVGFANAAAPVSGGTVTPSGVSCSVQSGDVTTGQLLKCTVSLSAGIPATSGTAKFSVSVTPVASAAGNSVTNKAAVDSTGGNAAQTPANCTGANTPTPGCTTSAPQTVGNGVNLSLSKSNPANLAVGAASNYSFSISNTGTGVSGASLDVYEQLPAHVAFNSGAGAAGGTVTPSGVACTVVSGNLASGQLLKCTVSLPSGLAAGTGTANFTLNVTPQPGVASSLINKAQIDPTGANGAQSPGSCTATGTPAGCAVTASQSVGSGVNLGLSKANPASLTVGVTSAYTLTLSNTGSAASGNSIDVYEQLPIGVGFANAAAPVSGGTVTPSGVSCSVQSGDVTTGQLLKCTVSFSAGLPASTGTAQFSVSVMPVASASGNSVINRAAVDSTGGNAAQAPANCTGANAPTPGCTTSAPQTVGSGVNLGLSKSNPASLAVGLASNYSFSISNTGSGASGTSLEVYEQLPAHVVFNSGAGAGGGTVTPSGVACTVVSGDLASGQLLKCTVSLPSGLAAGTGTANFTLNVTPQPGVASSLSNKAQIDPTGANAAQSPNTCTATGTPAGCAVTPSQSVGSGVNLGLVKANPATLAVGATSAYTLTLSNAGTGPSGNSIDVYDQLPVGVGFANAAAPLSGGTVTPSGVSCSVQSGDVTSGQLLKCTVSLSAGIPAGTGSAQFSVSVTPVASASGSSVVNRAAVDSTGSNTAQTPANCTGTNTPTAGCAATPGLTVSSQAQLQLTFNTVGGNNTFAINAGTGGNGFAATTLTTTGATGTPAQGSGSITPQGLNTGASTVPFSLPAGWSATGGSCTVSSSGAAAPGSAAFAGTASTGTFSFDATATAAGNVIRCQATLVKLPTLQLSVLRPTGNGAVTFTTQPSATAGNGYTAQSFASAGASSTPVAGSPNPTEVLAAASSPTQLSLSGPAAWVISSASCVDANSAASGNPSGTFDVSVSGGTTLALTAGQVPAGANLVCTATVSASAGQTVSGLVLQDNGAGGGTAHDGIKNGAEAGRPGVTMTLGNCSGTTYASTVTDGEGRFSLSTAAAVPGPVCLVETSPGAWVPVSSQVGNTAGSFNGATRSLSFTLSAGTDYSGIVFGEVPISLLTGDGRQHLQPGQSVVYAHSFTAGSSASVVFSTADQPSQSGAPWTSTVYLDSQCNAGLDASDAVLTGPVSVTAGQTVCLLVRVFSPASAAHGSTDSTTLTATETYQPTPQLGPVVRVQTKADVTTVGVNASGALTLVKEVRKVASCPSTPSDTLPFSASNTAMPGSFLEYRLSYANGSSGAVTGIQIADTVPAYTGFQSAGCGTLPNGLAACSVTDQPALGATGPLVWKLTDSSAAPIGLQSGGSGSVVFCVRLAN
ncbi:hypothetical protein PSQ20_17765 [Curvibacter sp. RS43]|uniref:beta strand repeat-containing protein n=1 Tax=Curvibacter microcysteis TaxID=3026419 RepID=UPI00235FD814|nr:hypothetical protein [Curvibacter sp. RS43]MDD0812202.1 hypothetical protein [Curvibacter sp. RS43]